MPKSDRLARSRRSPTPGSLIRRLQPEALHTLIQRRGLRDSADLVAQMTADQLRRVLDIDVWRGVAAGSDERLDADRFGVWLEVLTAYGATVAAEKLMGVDIELVIAALAQHVRVFDRAATDQTGFEVGGYVLIALRTASWDAILELLLHLDAEHHDYFDRVMAGCRRLSNAGFEIDGLHHIAGAVDQQLFDVAADRERRRTRRGFVSPAQARAFLRLARTQAGSGAARVRNPIVAAYFGEREHPAALVPMHDTADADRAIEELAFLANALVAGCSIQGRAFTAGEASMAVAAICALGREHAPDAERDAIRAFEIGWRLLYQDVCLATANRLVSVLRDVQVVDREIQSRVDALRLQIERSVRAGEPWRSSDALDVMMIFDMTAWAALVGLVAECPVIHAAIGAHGSPTVSAIDFSFISTRAQLASVSGFLRVLPTCFC